jgi:hypothetical protein
MLQPGSHCLQQLALALHTGHCSGAGSRPQLLPHCQASGIQQGHSAQGGVDVVSPRRGHATQHPGRVRGSHAIEGVISIEQLPGVYEAIAHILKRPLYISASRGHPLVQIVAHIV